MSTIDATTTADDIISALDIGYTLTPEGAIRCQLSGGRSLLLYQHEQCSGGLDSFGELPGLLA